MSYDACSWSPHSPHRSCQPTGKSKGDCQKLLRAPMMQNPRVKTRDNKRFAAAGNKPMPPFITHAWNSYVPLIMSDRVPCTCRNRWSKSSGSPSANTCSSFEVKAPAKPSLNRCKRVPMLQQPSNGRSLNAYAHDVLQVSPR